MWKGNWSREGNERVQIKSPRTTESAQMNLCRFISTQRVKGMKRFFGVLSLIVLLAGVIVTSAYAQGSALDDDPLEPPPNWREHQEDVRPPSFTPRAAYCDDWRGGEVWNRSSYIINLQGERVYYVDGFRIEETIWRELHPGYHNISTQICDVDKVNFDKGMTPFWWLWGRRDQTQWVKISHSDLVCRDTDPGSWMHTQGALIYCQ